MTHKVTVEIDWTPPLAVALQVAWNEGPRTVSKELVEQLGLDPSKDWTMDQIHERHLDGGKTLSIVLYRLYSGGVVR